MERHKIYTLIYLDDAPRIRMTSEATNDQIIKLINTSDMTFFWSDTDERINHMNIDNVVFLKEVNNGKR